MPRKFYKKRPYRRRRYGRKGYNWGGMSKFYKTVAENTSMEAVWAAINGLKGLINSEMHKLDFNNTTTVTTSGTLDGLCKVAVGDTYADRTGNSIYARALNIEGTVAWNFNSATGTQTCRIAIVKDLQQIADTDPVWTDVYDVASNNAHLNPATVGRFKILYNRVYSLEANKPLVNFRINLPMRHHIRFNGTAGTDIQKGALYIAYIYGGNAAPTLSYRSRLSFHDN